MPIKIPMASFTKIEKNNSNICVEPCIAKAIMKKKKLTLPDSKLYYKTIEIKKKN